MEQEGKVRAVAIEARGEKGGCDWCWGLGCALGYGEDEGGGEMEMGGKMEKEQSKEETRLRWTRRRKISICGPCSLL